ncbi:GDP-mannose 4,6-dehydratase [Hymenobacter fastidiosus]|uniref:GDP-mannose 4,6-dehydratase n=1 Tax=Hymenobacter fastidiosus TaxID=486264 RepID=A0ABP7SEK9_9BACT
MASILITGCAGFIGSHLTERLLLEGHRVIGLDNFDPFYARGHKQRNLTGFRHHPFFTFVEADLRHGFETLLDSGSPEPIEVVVHLAAKAGVGPSVKEPIAYLENNIIGTTRLLQWMRQRKIQKLFFASSSSVYGNTRQQPFQEDMNVLAHGISPYAVSKLTGEQLTATYHHLYGLDVLNARFFTVYGPRQRPDLAIHKFARLMQAGQPVPVFGDGTTARDYTYVDDTVDGIVRSIAYLLQHTHVCEVVNLGNNRPVPLLALIQAVGEALGCQPELEFLPMQAGDVNVTYADISKAHRLLGYAPKTTLAQGLAEFVQWLETEPKLYEPASPVG